MSGSYLYKIAFGGFEPKALFEPWTLCQIVAVNVVIRFTKAEKDQFM